MSTAVLVTGVGVVAPNGLGTDAWWHATLEGKTGIQRINRFDVSGYSSTLAGQIVDLDTAAHLGSRLLAQTDVSTQFALIAADWALADAKVDPDVLVDYEMGVVTANATGGFEFTHKEFRKLWSQGPESVSVYESFAWFYAVNTGQISIRNIMRGPSSALVAEQAGGLDALGHARRTIRRGTPLVVAGGVDSALDPWGWASQISSGRLSTGDDPSTAYRPFDAAASGYVPGEGGAILVLEDAAGASERGIQEVFGEFAGYACTFDPHPRSARPPGLQRAIELALIDAGVKPDEIDVVLADGIGIPQLDEAEAAAIAAVFGANGVPVSVPKALTGRLYAGGGPVDVVAALLAIRDDLIPPTATTSEVPERYAIDLVRCEPRPARVTTALVLARGRWGFNAAVVLRAVD